MSLKRVMLLVFLSCNTIISNGNVHYIGPGYAGMFGCINIVLHDLLWCELNNRIPVVFWDSRSHYYNPGGFNGNNNVWEYYFQPVGPINPRPSYTVPRPAWTLGYMFANEFIDQETRNKAQRIIDKYVRFN